MSDFGFTPGPWDIFSPNKLGRRPGIEAEDFSIVVWGNIEDDSDDGGVDGRTDAEIQANARLISVAPDMAYALQDLIHVASGYPMSGIESEQKLAKAIAVLAKARGE